MRNGQGEDPLVADLRRVEEIPRRTSAGQRQLVAALTVLPELAMVRSFVAPGDWSEPRGICVGLDNTFKLVTRRLLNEHDQQATAFLLRLTPESGHASAADLLAAAARCYPGRDRAGVGDERMKPSSFTRFGGPHDRLLMRIADVIRDLDDEVSSRQAPDEAVAALAVTATDGAQSVPPGYPLEYYLPLFTSVCRLEGQQPTEIVSTRLVTALKDGVERLGVGFASAQRDLEVVYGGTAEFDLRGGGFSHADIRLAEPPMRAGETRLVITRGRYLNEAGPVTYRRHAPGRLVTSLVVLGVQFTPHALPAHVWWYDSVPAIHAPTPFAETRRLVPNSLHYVEKHFVDQPPHTACGIAWEW